MKSILRLLFTLFPIVLFAQNETFDVRHNLSFRKNQVKNTAHIEGIRFFDATPARTLFINGTFDGVYGRNFYTSWGGGVRNYFSQFGFGLNGYWDFSNETKFPIHQIGFGVECLFEKFSFFYNQNMPLTKDRSKLLYKIYFSNSYQIGFKHNITPDLFYAISANFREDSPRIGAKIEIAKQFKHGFSIATSAAYDGNKSPVFGLSLGYHFGGIKPTRYQKPVRNQQINYKIIYAKIRQVKDKILITPPEIIKIDDPEKKNGWIPFLSK